MIALMVTKLALHLLAKIVLNVVLLSLPGDVPSDDGLYNAIPQLTSKVPSPEKEECNYHQPHRCTRRYVTRSGKMRQKSRFDN